MPDARLYIATKSPPCSLWQSSILQRPHRHYQERWFRPTRKVYSVAEAMEKYGLRRDDVYNYTRYNNIRKMHHGKSMFLLIEDFDNVMAEKSVTENYSIADKENYSTMGMVCIKPFRWFAANY